jgi:diguanylate cyclase (GGDEF)-like protein/PAS domain S-box-containing protein
MTRRGAAGYAAVGAVAVVVHALLPPGLVRAALYDLVGLSASVGLVVGVRRHRPVHRKPWLLLALGQLLFVLGDANQVFHDQVLHRVLPTPSLTDALWLPAYAVLVAGVLLLVRVERRPDRVALVDACVLAASLGVLVWTYVAAPQAVDGTLTVTERLLGVLYPLMDLLLIAVTFRLALRRARGDWAQRLLVASMLALFFGDDLFAQQLLDERLVNALVYPLWLGAYLAAGAAGLHPSMARQADDDAPAPVPESATPDWARLWLLAGCCLVGPAVLVVEWLRGATGQVPALAVGSGALFLLVVLRLSLMTDAAQQLERVLAARRSDRRFTALVQGASDVILVVDADGRLWPETPSVAAVLGHEPEALRGQPLTTLFDEHDAEVLRGPSSQDLRGEFPLRHGDGTWRTVDVVRQDRTAEPEVGGLVLTVRDVTERTLLEERLQRQATHDELTGLPNRGRFLEELDVALGPQQSAPLTVLYLDLDGFKAVNDAVGHHWGDRLLVGVAERIAAVLRPVDVLCRLSGDEFAVLLPGLAAVDGCLVAERVHAALVAPLDLGDRTLRAGASIGVRTVEPGSGSTASDVLAAADTAMYASKRAGRDRWTLFEQDMQARLVRRNTLDARLRAAVESAAVDVAYQPLVCFADGAVVGFEALARWTDAELGPVSPVEFVPRAEETGLVVALGRQVLEQACGFLVACNDGRDVPLRMAVNVSVRQLQEPDFPGTVAAVLAATGLPAHLLTLEITESIRLFDGSADVLHLLKGLGVRLALDDFGTGFAALTHLTSLPIDEIKIDRSFVSAMEDGGRRAQLVESVVGLGRRLQLEVVAEGVETDGQARRLRSLGCDLAQGWLFGRPEPAQQARLLLSRARVPAQTS